METEEKKNTAIFGDILYPESPSSIKPDIKFLLVNEYGLEQYNPIIIVTGTISNLSPRERKLEQVIAREKEIDNALRKGTHVCILCHDPNDPLFLRLLSSKSIQFIKSAIHIPEMFVKRSEFSSFLNDFGTSFGIYSSTKGFDYVISTVDKVYVSALFQENITTYGGGYVTGFTCKKHNGLITFLPFFIPQSVGKDWQRAYKIITDLILSLDTHKKNIIFEHHSWINDFKLDKEKQLESEIVEIENQITPKRISLERLRYLKSTLWLKHDELRDVCMQVFSDMALKTLKHDVGQEDFWILDDANSRVCICEIKGKDKHLEMGDLIKFEANRDAAGKDENFPSLLIANTYNRACSLSEKDQNIDSNVIQKAVRNNILIMRTLDLLKMFNRYQNNEISTEKLLNILTSPSGGWLRVREKIDILLR
jgi:hypothetical protein